MIAQAMTQTMAKPAITPVAHGLLQRCTATTECEDCRRKREGTLQRAAVNSSPVSEVPPIVHDVLGSPGQPLDAQTRAFMEPRFSHDFSSVRIHTDAKAAESARSVNALAYTVGRDVVFGTGSYTPCTNSGKRLLAHELTHVVQQAGQNQKPTQLTIGTVADSAEREAEAASNFIADSRPVPVTGQTITPLLQRQHSRSAPIREAPEEAPLTASTPRRGTARQHAETAPTDLPCRIETGHRRFTGTNIMFAHNSAALSASDDNDIGRYVRDWVASGSREPIRIDGYASVEGPEAYNLRLSCRRALAVRNKLIQLGVPAPRVTTVAHGETTEFAPGALSPNRRVILSAGQRVPRGHRPESARSSCGDIDDFFRTILLVDPGLVSDIVTCFCFGASLADLIPEMVPAEIVDCLCNVYLIAQQIYQRGSDGGCWSASNISAMDIAALYALAGLTGLDCAMALDAVIGALAGTAVEPGGGTVAGAGLGVLGGLIIDLATMAAQNLIVQGTPLPVSQLEACGRLITRLGSQSRRALRVPQSRQPRQQRDQGRSTPTTPPQPTTSTPPATFVCGPDITAHVGRAVNRTASLFRGWSRTNKERACSALVEPPEAAFAWDIIDLHDAAKGGSSHNWIIDYRCQPPGNCGLRGVTTRDPRQVCATAGASPSCAASVQVGNQCYFVGSANYVIFGTMIRLCRNEFGGVEFSETAMRALVDLYKLGGATGENVGTAKGWASAGFHGWPSGGTPPAGDRSNCSPTCPTPFQGGSFAISWCPIENPYTECTSPEAAIISIIEHVF